MATTRITMTGMTGPSMRFELLFDESDLDPVGNKSTGVGYLRATYTGSGGGFYSGNNATVRCRVLDGSTVLGSFQVAGADANIPLNSGWTKGAYNVSLPRLPNGARTVTLELYANYPSSGFSKTMTTTLKLATLTQKPGTPLNPVLEWVSDTQLSASVTRVEASNGAAASMEFQTRVNDGGWTDYQAVSPVSSLIVTTALNRKTEFRVRASNSAGTSDWSAPSAPVFTTPAALTGVKAVKNPDNSITVSWDDATAYTEHEHPLEHGVVSGGVATWDAVPLTPPLAGGAASYKHVSPNMAQVHVYRARSRTTDVSGRASGWAVSGYVQLPAPPNPPTMSALPAYSDAAKSLSLSWAHNPVDATEQTGYRLRHSVDDGATWVVTAKTAGAVSAAALPAGLFSAGATVQVQVQTWGLITTGGSDGTGASDWSSSATTTFETAPVLSIITPVSGVAWETSTVVVCLDMTLPDGATWVNATIRLYRDGVLLGTRVTSTPTFTTLSTVFQNGETYEIRVTGLDSHGLSSDEVVSWFPVSYLAPVPAGVEAVYLPEHGAAQLNLTIPAPGVGQAPAAFLAITRAIEDDEGDAPGVEPVVERTPVSGGAVSFVDAIPTINGVNTYTVTTFSADDASTSVEAVLATSETRWAFVNAGACPTPGAGIVKFMGDLELGSDPTRASALFEAEGRRKPIAQFGEARGLTVTGSATIAPGIGSSRAAIEKFAQEATRVWYRDPTRRMFGQWTASISKQTRPGRFELRYTVTETDAV